MISGVQLLESKLLNWHRGHVDLESRCSLQRLVFCIVGGCTIYGYRSNSVDPSDALSDMNLPVFINFSDGRSTVYKQISEKCVIGDVM